MSVRKKAVIAVAILAAVLVPVLFLLWPQIQFKMDRMIVERTIVRLGTKDPFEDPLLSRPWHPDRRTQIPRMPASETSNPVDLSGLGVSFPADYAVTRAGKKHVKAVNAKLQVGLIDSAHNDAFTLSSADASFLTETAGASGILSFMSSAKPPDILEAVLASTPQRIDEQTDLDSKYRELYLFSLKAVLLPRAIRDGFRVLETEHGTAYVFGDIAKGAVVADFYSEAAQRFVTVIFKNKGSAGMEDIERFIAGLRVAKRPSPGAAPAR